MRLNMEKKLIEIEYEKKMSLNLEKKVNLEFRKKITEIEFAKQN